MTYDINPDRRNEPKDDNVMVDRDAFIQYLRETLIPDLHESGRHATADDFETACRFMENAGADQVEACNTDEPWMTSHRGYDDPDGRDADHDDEGSAA